MKNKRETTGKIRLNKYLAHAGIGTRKECDKLINKGLVTVNGKIITENGSKVFMDDKVVYEGQEITSEKKLYVLLNKPKDFSTAKKSEKPAIELLSAVAKFTNLGYSPTLEPTHQFDEEMLGLVLYTNDSEILKNVEKHKTVYQIELVKKLTKKNEKEINNWLGEREKLGFLEEENRTIIGLEVWDKTVEQISTLFETLKVATVRWDSMRYGNLTKKNLPRGKWRLLTDKEVVQLKYFLEK